MTALVIGEPEFKAAGGSDSVAILAAFLAENPGAQAAAKSLRAGAEVALTLADVTGDWRVVANPAGQLSFEQGKATDPDFELHVPTRAVQRLCASSIVDVGELGTVLFELIVSPEQELRIHLKVHSGLIKLTRRGWLRVVSQGGPTVMTWLAKKGLHGPGAITAALRKLSG
jgi:hypothetical protein